jgi:hypothetical protein
MRLTRIKRFSHQWIVAAASGIIAALIAAQPLANAMWNLLLDDDGKSLIQHVPKNGLPVPVSMHWPEQARQVVETVGSLTPSLVIVWHLLLYLCALYILIRVLNPTFHLTSGVDVSPYVLTRTYFHSPPFIKALLIGVTAAIPIFCEWELIAHFMGGSPLSLGLRLGLTSAILWVLYSIDGVAGDFDNTNYRIPDRKEIFGLASLGFVFGAIASLAVIILKPLSPVTWIHFYRSLGFIGINSGKEIAWIVMGCAAWVGFALGAIAYACSKRNTPFSARIGEMAIPVALLAWAWFYTAKTLPNFMRSCDFPLQINSVDSVAKLILGSDHAPKTRIVNGTMLLITKNNATPIVTPLQTNTGFPANSTTETILWRYLQKHHYQTALSMSIYQTLHDIYALEWDSAKELQLDNTFLLRSPSDEVFQLFIQKIEGSGDARLANRYIDILADPKRFTYPDRDSLVYIGDLYARFGNRAKAEIWYRKAKLPNTRDRLNSQTLFSDGEIDGSLYQDGKPLAHVRVGLMPEGAVGGIFFMPYENGYVSPYSLRWVCCTTHTDANGRFQFDNLASGRYVLLAYDKQWKPNQMFTASDKLWKSLFVCVSAKHIHVGTIHLSVAPPAKARKMRQFNGYNQMPGYPPYWVGPGFPPKIDGRGVKGIPPVYPGPENGRSRRSHILLIHPKYPARTTIP